jgi:hypothetical protein
MPAPPPSEGNARPPPKKSLTKNQKKNLKDRQARRAQRELSGGDLKECSKKHRGLAKRHPLGVDADVASDLPHSKPAWVGLRELEDDWNIYGLEELQGRYGLRLFEWDGK